jgi:hypothetical protein
MEKVCNEWSAREFYHQVRYKAFEGQAQKRYSELMTAKANQK